MARPKKAGYVGSFHESVVYRTSKRSECAAICHRFKNAVCRVDAGIHEFDLTGRRDIRNYIESKEFASRVVDFDGILLFLEGSAGAGAKRRGRKPGRRSALAGAVGDPMKAGKKKRRRRRTGEELAAAKREAEIRKAVTKRLKMNRPGKRSAEDAQRLEVEVKKELAKK
ncbi:hypothetical protein IT570_14090 [Candidatus Sumerlaeota bacterium]|nr:hypothetical protein [Candidatus Sumerlaeota bacterium]